MVKKIKNNSKIKKYFQTHKIFCSVVCYKLTREFIKKFIDTFVNKNKFKLANDAYWYLIENISNDFQILKNELEKISNYNKENISLSEIRKIVSNDAKLQLDNLFFQSAIGNNKLIIKNSELAISSSKEVYGLLQIVKTYSKILVKTSENKDKKSDNDLVEYYLPKYLFKQKNNFKNIIKRTTLDKIILINSLIQKTELLLRKNDTKYLIIVQRFLLNFAKILR